MTRGSDLGPLDELARQSFAFFVRRVFETLNPGQTYMHNWHIDAICHECERVWRGLTTRLMIEMPPRSLKSIIISVAFPAFILGHDPSKHFICASYAQTLSTKNHDDFRRVLESDWYQRTFPHTRVGDWKDTGQEVILTGSGSRFATSVGGALTGRGADFLILDDLLKAQDANSETVRTGANLWVSNTAMSRLNNPGTGVVIVVAQRLHVDDVVGYLCDRSPGRWKVLSLPAIALEDVEIATGWAIAHMFRKDELLHPERLPRAVLDRIRE
jgi:hypothetical protein